MARLDIEITREADRDTASVVGWVCVEGCEPTDFAGWLELLLLLERSLDDHPVVDRER